MKFVKIKAGKFLMGENQIPVELTKNFEIMTTQVTQKQWKSIMINNPSSFKGNNNPVEMVSWEDTQKFISKLNDKQSKYSYRLPTEAEWEYACRAGTTSIYNFGDSERDLEKYAWFYTNSKNKTHKVASKEPNKWGIYDMHGNVLEWVHDWYRNILSGGTDPLGPDRGSDRVIRGGSWYYDAQFLRSADRGNGVPSYRYGGIGFRLVRTLRSNLLPSNASKNKEHRKN